MLVMKKVVALLVVLFLTIFICNGARISEEEDDSDIEARLNILNKPPVLTFDVHGEIIDCVEYNKQPAFDNPMLKNHSILMNPNFDINGTPEVKANGMKILKGFQRCPSQTVPIKRTTKEDLLRHKSLKSFHLDFVDPKKDRNPKHLVALLRLWRYGKDVVAVRAAVSSHNPSCSGKQMTASLIGIINDEIDSKDNMFAGLVKYPHLFGDDRTRLTIFWNNREQGEGCFNLLCPGFVQVHQTFFPGNIIDRFSVFQGQAYESHIEINQDRETKNWWLIFQGKRVGYWPRELFSEIERGAGAAIFGGVTTADENNVFPQMGFGSFPETSGKGDYLKQSGFMRLMEYNSSLRPSDTWDGGYNLENSHDCYRVINKGKTEQHGAVIIFGGPGGSRCTNN